MIVVWSSWREGPRQTTLWTVAVDLQSFFAVVAKGPVKVTAADVFGFLTHQRRDRSVIWLADPGVGRLPIVVGVGPLCLLDRPGIRRLGRPDNHILGGAEDVLEAPSSLRVRHRGSGCI
jgi:hypothetical protein